MNTTYPSDLTDAEWECLQRSLLESHSHCRTRRHSLRSSLNAIFYVLRTSCPWRDVLSRVPPSHTAVYHFRRVRLRRRNSRLCTPIRNAEHEPLRSDPQPSAASLDAQSQQ